MNANLTVGNRVRVTTRNRMHGYHTGDKGIVLWGPSLPDAAGQLYYLVVMQKDANGNAVVFNADEIEPDVREPTVPTPTADSPEQQLEQTDSAPPFKPG
jgi:hypothetical protein